MGAAVTLPRASRDRWEAPRPSVGVRTDKMAHLCASWRRMIVHEDPHATAIYHLLPPAPLQTVAFAATHGPAIASPAATAVSSFWVLGYVLLFLRCPCWESGK